jgi:hypothetical protein
MPKRVRRGADYVRWLIEEGLCDYDDLRRAGLLGPPRPPNPRRRPAVVDPSTVFVMDKPLAYSHLGPLLAEAHRAERAAQAR